MPGARAESFDGHHVRPGRGGDRRHAGAHRRTVEMNRAGPAQRDAATVLRTGKAKVVAQHPQQRRIGLDIDADLLTVDLQIHHAVTCVCACENGQDSTARCCKRRAPDSLQDLAQGEFTPLS
jgi:hypothetical protein